MPTHGTPHRQQLRAQGVCKRTPCAKLFASEELSKDLYEKYNRKFIEKKNEIQKKISSLDFNASNLSNFIDSALYITMNLSTEWMIYSYSTKQKIQNLVFPEGIYYHKENGSVEP